MRTRRRIIAAFSAAVIVAALMGSSDISPLSAQTAVPDGPSLGELKDKLSDEGKLSVLVTSDDGTEVNFQQYGLNVPNDNMEMVDVTSEEQLENLYEDPNVGNLSVDDSTLAPTASFNDVDTLAPAAAVDGENGGSGDGLAIAIIDTAFDTGNTQLSANGKIIWEHCSTINNACPNGQNTMDGTGAADDAYCTGATGCDHGTQIAEIAGGYAPGQAYEGIAPDVSFILIRAGILVSGGTVAEASTSGTINALDWLDDQIDLNTFGMPVVAVNMSLGGGTSTSTNCDTADGFAWFNNVANLRDDGAVVVASSGNSGLTNGMVKPACVSNIVSVAGTVGAAIATNSNLSGWTDIAAPYSQAISFGSGTCNGTSCASAAVSGAVASIATPTPPVGIGAYDAYQMEAAIKYVNNGQPTVDNRTGCACWGINRFHLDNAYEHMREVTLGASTSVALWNQFRILDTRTGFGVQSSGGSVVKLGAGTWTFNMQNILGVPAASIKAVLLNVAAVNATATSYVSVGPGNFSSPTWSNVNTSNGMDATSVSVWAQVDSNGVLGIANFTGSVDIIVDVQGIIPDNTDTTITAPTRVFDTRSGGGGTICHGCTRVWDPRGVGPIPSSGVTGIYGTLSVVNNHAGSSFTYIIAQEAGGSSATVNLFLDVNDIRSNTAMIKLATSGANAGKVEFYNGLGVVDVIFDLVGYTTTGDTDIFPAVPTRWLDTRPNHIANGYNQGLSGNTTPCGSSIKGVVHTATLISNAAGSYSLVYPFSQTPVPYASTVNAGNGQYRSNAGAVTVGAGDVSANNFGIYNYATVNTNDLTIDIQGCFGT